MRAVRYFMHIGSWLAFPMALSCEPRSGIAPRGDVAGDLAATRTASDTALLHAAQERAPAFLRDLAALVNIDSGTDNAEGLDLVSELLSARLEELGAKVEVSSAPPSAGKIVRGIFEGTGSAKVSLMIHYDTVFGKGEAQRRPMKIVGNKAFGPGVADAKGGIAIILHALAIARQRGLHDYRTLTILFTPDEEKGSLGSHQIIESLSAQQDWVLSYEPPDGERVIVGTKGIAHVQMDVVGRASHAGAAPEKGRNAAIEVAAQILQLDHLGDPAKGTTVNWTRIQGGEQINVIPDKASAIADMRLTDTSEILRVQHDAERIVQKHLVPDTQVTIKVESRRPPFPDNPSTDRLAALARRLYQELGKQLEPVAMSYGTDAGFAYRSDSPKPAILEGMGIVGGGLHSPDEWADLDSVAPRLYLTVRLLEVVAKEGR